MRIVVRCQEARAAREAQELLAAAGIEALALAGAARPAPNGEDITVFPAMGGEAESAAALAQASDIVAIARLAGLRTGAPPPLGLDHVAPFHGAIALDAPPKLLAAQVAAAIRAAEAHDERARRMLTAVEMNAPRPQPTEARKLRALYIGAPSPVFLSLERTFSQHGGLTAAAFSSFTGFDHLHDEPFDAVVLNGAQDAPTAISLCGALRRNASLYHLPTMMVRAPGDDATAAAAIERGASAVVCTTEPSGASLGWLFEAIRRERSRREAEHDGERRREDGDRDAQIEGAFSEASVETGGHAGIIAGARISTLPGAGHVRHRHVPGPVSLVSRVRHEDLAVRELDLQ